MTREPVGMWRPTKDKSFGEHLECSFLRNGTHYRCTLSWNDTGDWPGYEGMWIPWLIVRYTDEPMNSFGVYPNEELVMGNVGGEKNISKRRMWKTLSDIAERITEEKVAALCKP